MFTCYLCMCVCPVDAAGRPGPTVRAPQDHRACLTHRPGPASSLTPTQHEQPGAGLQTTSRGSAQKGGHNGNTPQQVTVYQVLDC